MDMLLIIGQKIVATFYEKELQKQQIKKSVQLQK